MTTVEESKDLFDNATANFPSIMGTPTNDNVKRILEVLTNLLQSTDVPGGKNSLSVLLGNADAYRSAYGHAFDRLEVSLSAYDLTIEADANTTTRVNPNANRPPRGTYNASSTPSSDRAASSYKP